jgi:hypothetical protein
MMHVRFSLVAADPPVLAGCIGYLEDEARPVLESQHGSLGLSLLEEPGVVIFESFWVTHEALWLREETEAVFRGELARRVERPVRAEDYQVAVFEREGGWPQRRRDDPGRGPGRGGLQDRRRGGLPPGVRLGAETGSGLVVKPRITASPAGRSTATTAT